MSAKKEDAIEVLCDTYRTSPQIGFVLGAGVSLDSGVPLYKELALKLAEEAHKQKKLLGVPGGAIDFLLEQAKLDKKDRKEHLHILRAGDPEPIQQHHCEEDMGHIRHKEEVPQSRDDPQRDAASRGSRDGSAGAKAVTRRKGAGDRPVILQAYQVPHTQVQVLIAAHDIIIEAINNVHA